MIILIFSTVITTRITVMITIMNMVYDINEKFSNKLTFSNTYIKRVYGATENSGNALQDNYYGESNHNNFEN